MMTDWLLIEQLTVYTTQCVNLLGKDKIYLTRRLKIKLLSADNTVILIYFPGKWQVTSDIKYSYRVQ